MPANASDHPEFEGHIPTRVLWQKMRDAAKIDKGFVSASIGDLLDAWEVFAECVLSVPKDTGAAATPGKVAPPPKDWEKKLDAAVIALNKLAPAMKEYEQKLAPQVQALNDFHALVKITSVGIGELAKGVTKSMKWEEARKKVAPGTPKKA